jgi:hypothetical protein
MGNFFAYLAAFLPYWWPLVTAGGLLGIDALIRGRWAWGTKQLNRIPARTRRHLEFTALLLAVFYAGFAAWQDEHAARELAEHSSSATAITDLQNQLAKFRAAEWLSLSDDAKAKLRAKLALISSHPITIACETRNCKRLSDDVATTFRAAHWGNVTELHRGGFDITGRTGIFIEPNSDISRSIKNAIETTTTLKVEVDTFVQQLKGNYEVTLVIGTKPF